VVNLPTEAEPVTVVEGDCLEVLRDLPDGCVDAVVTDPPYGVGFKYASHDDTPDGYGEWLWSVLLECERLCRPGSPLFVWQASKHARRFAEWFPRPWRLCIAAKNFAQVLPGPMWPSYEPVLAWWTPGESWVGGGCRRDFVLADTSPSSRKKNGDVVKGHPCPRPLLHARHFIGNWCRPGGVVIDPFGGSGTTGVASIKEGRRCLLIEKEPAYAAIARRRCREAMGTGLLEAARG
jgi:site-specific DNA-methyltransferase (adenine-specific)